MDSKAFRKALAKIDLRSPEQIVLNENKSQILAALERGISLATIHKLMVENGFKGSKKIVESSIKKWRGEPVKQRKTTPKKEKKEAAPAAPAPQSSGRVDLSVSIEEKDEAKALGAKWDSEKKIWYVPAGIDPGAFSKWR